MRPDQRQDPEDPREDAYHASNPNRVGMGMSALGRDFAWQARQIDDQKNTSGNERCNDEEGEDPIDHEWKASGRQTKSYGGNIYQSVISRKILCSSCQTL